MEVSEDLPYEILYNIAIMSQEKQNQIIDGWKKIDYTPDINSIISKTFKYDSSHIPGFDKIYQMIEDDIDKTTLLEELLSNCNIDDNSEYSNLSKLKDSR